MNEDNQTNLSDRIIDHLKQKEDKRDVLDGIIIAIYEKEMRKLSENIMTTLARLFAKGIISEHENHNGKRWFKLENQTMD